MRRRGATVAVNLIGLLDMGIIALLQTGLVRRLPEPSVALSAFPLIPEGQIFGCRFRVRCHRMV